MSITVRYFARLREALACEHETLDHVPTVADLVAVLRARGGAWADELAPQRAWRAAVAQQFATLHTAIPDGAEVAIFPPVTGG